MCGRAYETYTDEELYIRYIPRTPFVPLDLTPVYNLCPTQDSPIVRVVSDERRIERMRWQLVPPTEPTFSTKLTTINARSEGIFDSRLYRDLIVRQRCIVPLSGFYEWKVEGDVRRPFRIFLREEPIMSVAGIWSAWRPGTPDERHSFAVLTTSANGFMRDIHERMPVILSRGDEEAWLSPEIHEREHVQKLLKPCPIEWLKAVPVSPLVNSAKNNSPELLEPYDESTKPKPQPSLFD
jgi:putative SOS response-associated peptidase YedK